MPHERFFTPQPLEGKVVLTETEFHHLVHVMRGRIGDRIELINGENSLAHATVTAISKREAELTIDEVHTSPPPAFPLILAQGIPRFNRLETILEKGTELGVTEFWLFAGRLSEKEEFSLNQTKRMEQILIAAMKQCGRLDLPKIALKPPLLDWTAPSGTLFFGDTGPEAPWLWKYPKQLSVGEVVILCIGPEGGLDDKEKAHLVGPLGAHGVKLHTNILRTDTASLTGLSLLQLLIRN